MRIGAVVGGRWTYEAARHWGDQNPWGLPFFIVTQRPEEEPPGGFLLVIMGGGKQLFAGFTQSLDLEHIGVRQSPFATFIAYRVKCP